VFGSRRFLLFAERLAQKQAVFLPNSSKKEKSGGADLVLSNQILEAAKVRVRRLTSKKITYKGNVPW
jgi:hypothetical protein